ncbi:hypothetical protein I3843_11G047700 [Carya illinoinensis]|nr:hypothetical protein I3843_11G047700 [Carya illinoinensis]
MCVYGYICWCVCVCMCMCACVLVCVCACMCASECEFVCACTCVHVWVCSLILDDCDFGYFFRLSVGFKRLFWQYFGRYSSGGFYGDLGCNSG